MLEALLIVFLAAVTGLSVYISVAVFLIKWKLLKLLMRLGPFGLYRAVSSALDSLLK